MLSVQLGPPIDLGAHLESERAALLADLARLAPEEWAAPTACSGWSVEDVVAHILGDDLGRIGRGIASRAGETVADLVHRANAEWVLATRRLGPRLLVDLLEWAGPRVADQWSRLDPDAPSVGVSWAGIDPAPVWFDAARDLTEYWVHRQQIRLATGRRPDDAPARLHIVLDTFARGLPYALRGVAGGVQVVITGPAGGTWAAGSSPPTSRLELDQETAWRVWTRLIEPVDANAVIEGEREPALAALAHVAIVR